MPLFIFKSFPTSFLIPVSHEGIDLLFKKKNPVWVFYKKFFAKEFVVSKEMVVKKIGAATKGRKDFPDFFKIEGLFFVEDISSKGFIPISQIPNLTDLEVSEIKSKLDTIIKFLHGIGYAHSDLGNDHVFIKKLQIMR